MAIDLENPAADPLPEGLSRVGRSEPVDLLLLVDERRENGRSIFTFRPKTRDPKLGLNFAPIPGAPLRRDPQPYLRQLFREVETKVARDEKECQVAETRIANLGIELFDELLPFELRRHLWRFHSQIQTVEVVSNETWVPWELLKLRDPDRDDATGPFFGEAFALTRWLQGLEEALHLPLHDVALVVPGDSGLDHAVPEAEAIAARLRGKVSWIPAHYVELLEALGSGRYDGWHFNGHGFARDDQPGQWGLLLEEGQQLRSADLKGEARQLGRTQPLIFLNACHSGRGGDGLTGIGGLAAAFLEARAGALISAHWTLPDSHARFFAENFYYFLVEQHLPLGEAARQARQKVRKSWPGHSSWLAYTVFGHPLANSLAIDAEVTENLESPKSRNPSVTGSKPHPRSPRPPRSPRSPPSQIAGDPFWTQHAVALAVIALVLLGVGWLAMSSIGKDRAWLIRVAEAANSRPVQNAAVTFYTDSERYTTPTDSLGSAKLPAEVRGQSGRLVVESSDLAIHEQDLEAQSFIDIRLKPRSKKAANILFRVVDNQGRPWPHVELQLFLDSKNFIRKTDRTGLARFLVDFEDETVEARISIQQNSCTVHDQILVLKRETVQDVKLDCAPQGS